jgi:SAM-dependent methyltransferase
MIEEILKKLSPARVLDVGCGCGDTTRKRHALCRTQVAVDPLRRMAARWTREPLPGLLFLCMDGRTLGFRDHAFDLVMERASLHHIKDWERALAEMFRVSSGPVFLEEPVDDSRSPAKENAMRAQELFLELQHEVGYSHDLHIAPEALLHAMESHGRILERRLLRREEEVSFEAYFDGFTDFAAQSRRESYWLERLDRFRAELGQGRLVSSDILSILATKMIERPRS